MSASYREGQENLSATWTIPTPISKRNASIRLGLPPKTDLENQERRRFTQSGSQTTSYDREDALQEVQQASQHYKKFLNEWEQKQTELRNYVQHAQSSRSLQRIANDETKSIEPESGFRMRSFLTDIAFEQESMNSEQRYALERIPELVAVALKNGTIYLDKSLLSACEKTDRNHNQILAAFEAQATKLDAAVRFLSDVVPNIYKRNHQLQAEIDERCLKRRNAYAHRGLLRKQRADAKDRAKDRRAVSFWWLTAAGTFFVAQLPLLYIVGKRIRSSHLTGAAFTPSVLGQRANSEAKAADKLDQQASKKGKSILKLNIEINEHDDKIQQCEKEKEDPKDVERLITYMQAAYNALQRSRSGQSAFVEAVRKILALDQRRNVY